MRTRELRPEELEALKERRAQAVRLANALLAKELTLAEWVDRSPFSRYCAANYIADMNTLLDEVERLHYELEHMNDIAT